MSTHPDPKAAELGIEPWPGSPCKFCTGDSAVIKESKPDGTLVRMPSAEWCEQMNACAATIDWELIFSGR
jgi:hypothetical protein